MKHGSHKSLLDQIAFCWSLWQIHEIYYLYSKFQIMWIPFEINPIFFAKIVGIWLHLYYEDKKCVIVNLWRKQMSFWADVITPSYNFQSLHFKHLTSYYSSKIVCELQFLLTLTPAGATKCFRNCLVLFTPAH